MDGKQLRHCNDGIEVEFYSAWRSKDGKITRRLQSFLWSLLAPQFLRFPESSGGLSG